MSMSCPDIVYGPQCCPNLIKSPCSHPRALKLLLVKSAANISVLWLPECRRKNDPLEASCTHQNSTNNTFLYYNIAKVAEIRLKIQKYIYTVCCSSSLSNFTSSQYKTSPGWAPVNVSMVMLKQANSGTHSSATQKQVKKQNEWWQETPGVTWATPKDAADRRRPACAGSDGGWRTGQRKQELRQTSTDKTDMCRQLWQKTSLTRLCTLWQWRMIESVNLANRTSLLNVTLELNRGTFTLELYWQLGQDCRDIFLVLTKKNSCV